MAVFHPYFPQDAYIPTYKPNTISVVTILTGFFAAVSLLIYGGYSMSASKKGISTTDRWAVVWFLLCGCIHSILEGYFVVNASKIAGDSHVLGQVWKEYAQSDSRYLTGDAAVWSIEAVTAFFWGPASFLLVYAILESKAFRHALQFTVCFGQLYGCVLYYMTSALDGFKDSNPAPQYFYGYFVLMNLPWIVVPVLLCVSSVKAMNSAFSLQASNVASKGVKVN